jgi:hypothetical protein
MYVVNDIPCWLSRHEEIILSAEICGCADFVGFRDLDSIGLLRHDLRRS